MVAWSPGCLEAVSWPGLAGADGGQQVMRCFGHKTKEAAGLSFRALSKDAANSNARYGCPVPVSGISFLW